MKTVKYDNLTIKDLCEFVMCGDDKIRVWIDSKEITKEITNSRFSVQEDVIQDCYSCLFAESGDCQNQDFYNRSCDPIKECYKWEYCDLGENVTVKDKEVE